MSQRRYVSTRHVMHLQRTFVVVTVVVVLMSHVACPSALPLAHSGNECGQNPMHAVQLVSQKTGILHYIALKLFRASESQKLLNH